MKEKLHILIIFLFFFGLVQLVTAGIPEGNGTKKSSVTGSAAPVIQKPPAGIQTDKVKDNSSGINRITVTDQKKSPNAVPDTLKPVVQVQSSKSKSSGDYVTVAKEIFRRILAYLF